MIGASSPDRGSAHHELARVAVDSVEDYAIYALDVDGRVVTWNAGARQMTGHAVDEIVGRPISTLYTDADVDAGKPERDLAIAMADGRLQEEDWRVRKDGTTFWASVLLTALRADDGRLIGFGSVTRDITERHRAEGLLRESEERFRLLVNSVADYAIFLLDPTGLVSSWNLGAERLKGYRAEEVIGRQFSMFYPVEDARANRPTELLREASEAGRVESEGWRLRKDGSRFWASVVITALRRPDGTLYGFAKVTKDLTDRKRNDDALRGILERERNAAQRLRELDEMRASVLELVAHDLHAPLNVIQSLACSLESSWNDLAEETRRQYLERIVARATVMRDLVDDLSDVVTIDGANLEVESKAFDLRAAIDQAVADAFAEPDLARLQITTSADLRAWGDQRRTSEIITNLLTNAAKFSAATTPITITAGCDTGWITTSVTDCGTGIPPDQQHLLFQRFSRLDGARDTPGTGIGLFIAKSLTEAQGGSISVVSEVGRGSTFSFTLRSAP